MPAESEIGYDRRTGPRDRTLRVGDSEREAVGEILRQQHLAGRLDSEEFEERLGRCLTAKTYLELDRLVADFPIRQADQGRVGRAWGWRPWPFALLPLAVVAALVLIGGHLIWLAFPLVFLFVFRPLAWRFWGHGYGRRGWACGPRLGG